MSINAKLLPLATPAPGLAILQIRGWEGDAASLEFAIQRNQDDKYLQHNRQWGNAPCWFAQDFTEDTDGESISQQVGAAIVDPLLQSSATGIFNFRLRSSDGAYEDENPMRLAPGLLSSLAGGESPVAAESSTRLVMESAVPVLTPEQEQAQEPITVSVDETIAAEPLAIQMQNQEETPAAVQNKGSKLPLLITLLVAASVIAAVLWFLLGNKKQEQAPVASNAPAMAVAPAANQPQQAAAPCSTEAMASESELTFVQNCIRHAPGSEQLLQVIEQAKAGNHCGVAQRLYANRAQAGDLLIANAYAREYDPKYHQSSSCFNEPDNATATYWYEHILSYEPDNTEAKARFEELKP